MGSANPHEDLVLTVKEAVFYSKLGKTLFYSILGTAAGPPIKRVRGRILIPRESFFAWLTTPSKTKKRK